MTIAYAPAASGPESMKSPPDEKLRSQASSVVQVWSCSTSTPVYDVPTSVTWKFCIAGRLTSHTASGPENPNEQFGRKSSVRPTVEPVTLAVVMTWIGSLSLLQPSAGWP